MIVNSLFNKTLKNFSKNEKFYSVDFRFFDCDLYNLALEVFPDEPKQRDMFISSVNRSFIKELYKRFKKGGFTYLAVKTGKNKVDYYRSIDDIILNQGFTPPPCYIQLKLFPEGRVPPLDLKKPLFPLNTSETSKQS